MGRCIIKDKGRETKKKKGGIANGEFFFF